MRFRFPLTRDKKENKGFSNGGGSHARLFAVAQPHIGSRVGTVRSASLFRDAVLTPDGWSVNRQLCAQFTASALFCVLHAPLMCL
ncbi:MAG: hypothetical protein ABJI00_11845 [Paracoccaceae bacterium]